MDAVPPICPDRSSEVSRQNLPPGWAVRELAWPRALLTRRPPPSARPAGRGAGGLRGQEAWRPGKSLPKGEPESQSGRRTAGRLAEPGFGRSRALGGAGPWAEPGFWPNGLLVAPGGQAGARRATFSFRAVAATRSGQSFLTGNHLFLFDKFSDLRSRPEPRGRLGMGVALQVPDPPEAPQRGIPGRTQAQPERHRP
jgi:hypothetical protein